MPVFANWLSGKLNSYPPTETENRHSIFLGYTKKGWLQVFEKDILLNSKVKLNFVGGEIYILKQQRKNLRGHVSGGHVSPSKCFEKCSQGL